MHFISNIFKGIAARVGVRKEGLTHCDGGRNGNVQEADLSKIEEEVLENGDEAVTEMSEDETKEDMEEKMKDEEIEKDVMKKDIPEQEVLKAVVPIKTTGSVGNFGKHLEIGKETGSLGERLGRLASEKEEHHYFQ